MSGGSIGPIPGSTPVPGAPVAGGSSPTSGAAAALVPGAIISGRVLEQLAPGVFTVNVRGDRLVAESPVALTLDSVVRFAVGLPGSDGAPRLQLLTPGPGGAAASPVAQPTPTDVGLPDTPESQALLAALQDLGVPLVPGRLQAAVRLMLAANPANLISGLLDDSGTDAPSDPLTGQPLATTDDPVVALLRQQTPDQQTKALAILTGTRLPITPATVGVALRAVTGQLPDASALWQALAEDVSTAAPAAAPAAAPPPVPGRIAVPLSPGLQENPRTSVASPSASRGAGPPAILGEKPVGAPEPQEPQRGVTPVAPVQPISAEHQEPTRFQPASAGESNKPAALKSFLTVAPSLQRESASPAPTRADPVIVAEASTRESAEVPDRQAPMSPGGKFPTGRTQPGEVAGIRVFAPSRPPGTTTSVPLAGADETTTGRPLSPSAEPDVEVAPTNPSVAPLKESALPARLSISRGAAPVLAPRALPSSSPGAIDRSPGLPQQRESEAPVLSLPKSPAIGIGVPSPVVARGEAGPVSSPASPASPAVPGSIQREPTLAAPISDSSGEPARAMEKPPAAVIASAFSAKPEVPVGAHGAPVLPTTKGVVPISATPGAQIFETSGSVPVRSADTAPAPAQAPAQAQIQTHAPSVSPKGPRATGISSPVESAPRPQREPARIPGPELPAHVTSPSTSPGVARGVVAPLPVVVSGPRLLSPPVIPDSLRPAGLTAVGASSGTLVIPNVAGLSAVADLAAVLSALALAGLRSEETATSTTSAAPVPTLLERLAALPQESHSVRNAPAAMPDSDQAPALVPNPEVPVPPQLTTAHLALAREIAAPVLFPPPDLPDYDRVFALPLMAQGQPTPARVAVATRHAANGTTTTFLRVDCELSRLGSVSVRLSGGHGGPMAITVFAGRRGAPAIAAGLPALMADLKARGFDAAVRIVQEDQP